MSIVTYPLNGVEYSAEDAELYNVPRTSGVYSGGDFPISVSENSATIGEGLAWIKNKRFAGKVCANLSAETLDLGAADSINYRYDVVALQFDVAENKTKFVVKRGTAGITPSIPERNTSETLYELYLYVILRAPGETSINSLNVMDVRLDRQYCGIMADSVTSIMDHISLESKEEKPENADIWKQSESLFVEANSVNLTGKTSAILAKSGQIDFMSTLNISSPGNYAIDCGYNTIKNVALPESQHDAVPKRYVDSLHEKRTLSSVANIAGTTTGLTCHFVKSGNIVQMVIASTVPGSFNATSGSISIRVPDGFFAVSESVVGSAALTALWHKSAYIPKIVGSVSIFSSDAVNVYYDFTNSSPKKGDTLSASLFWITGNEGK